MNAEELEIEFTKPRKRLNFTIVDSGGERHTWYPKKDDKEISISDAVDRLEALIADNLTIAVGSPLYIYSMSDMKWISARQIVRIEDPRWA